MKKKLDGKEDTSLHNSQYCRNPLALPLSVSQKARQLHEQRKEFCVFRSPRVMG